MDGREIIANAVSQSISGVTSVTVRPHQSGFTRGWRIDLERERDSMSTEELIGVLNAVCSSAKMSEGRIVVYAWVKDSDNAIDLGPAAEGLPFDHLLPGHGIWVFVTDLVAAGYGS